MKSLVLLFALALTVSLGAQNSSNNEALSLEKNKLESLLSRISITATAGTAQFASDDLKQFNWKHISLSQLTIAYKLNSRISFGLSTMNNLAPATAGYYNAENQLISFCSEDDDDFDEDDDFEDDDFDDREEEDCDDDDWESLIGQNLMGIVNYKLSHKLPFFIQAAGGYSLAGNAPAYSAMIAYDQQLFAGLGLQGGIRFSDVLYQIPADAIAKTTTSGFRAELGLSWNF